MSDQLKLFCNGLLFGRKAVVLFPVCFHAGFPVEEPCILVEKQYGFPAVILDGHIVPGFTVFG